MNKVILRYSGIALVLALSTNVALAQEGFGTNTPDKSAVIDIVSNKRGLLIPRVDLTSTILAAPVSAPAQSLLVYNKNTTKSGGTTDVTPGYYYWDTDRWVRFAQQEDITAITLVGDVTGPANATKVEKIQGTAVSPTIPTTNGQTLVYNSVTNEWIPGTPAVNADDIVNPKNLSNIDGSITVTDGTGATLVNTNIEVAEGGITTTKLADDAVTTGKIVNGTILPEDLANAGNNQVLITSTAGVPEWVNQMSLELTANNGLTKTDKNIQLGGVLDKVTTITTDATNVFAIAGLQQGKVEDQSLVVEADGTLRQIKQAPRFFYMPAVIFDTAAAGTNLTRDLYQEYKNQFEGTALHIAHGASGYTMPYTGGMVASTGAPAKITTYSSGELYYYVSYYDSTVFSNLSISEDGKLTYTILDGADNSSFMNVVFVVK